MSNGMNSGHKDSANSLTPLLGSERQDVNIENGISCQTLTADELSSSATSTRRPFHYPPDHQNVGQLSYGTQDISEASVTYNRYRYYNRLTGANANSGRLQIPDHIIPWYFYIPRIAIQLESDSKSIKIGKQNSFITIFAIWNMLMGSSLLCLPWALHRAGLLCGVILLVLMTGLCLYTANLIIRIPKMIKLNVIEFSDCVQHLLGGFAHVLSLFSSLVTLMGGCIVYWVLMSNFLEHLITFVYHSIQQNSSIATNISEVVCLNPDDDISPENNGTNNVFFNDLSRVVPFVLAVLMAPIISLKSVNFFMKFNVIGSVSVIYLLIFATYKSIKWGVNVDFVDPNDVNYTELFDWNFPVMSGILGLALFVHNCVMSLLRTNKNPQNNERDLGIAYLLVGLTYLVIALLIYTSFPLSKDCIKDNILDNFESNDVLAFITRAFLLLQVFSLYPLLVLMLRIQVMHLLIPDSSPGYLHIISLNAVILCLCLAFALYYPFIGTIIRYCGAFSALIYIFSLPPLAYIKAKRLTGRPVPVIQYIFLYSIVIIGFFNFFAQFIVA